MERGYGGPGVAVFAGIGLGTGNGIGGWIGGWIGGNGRKWESMGFESMGNAGLDQDWIGLDGWEWDWKGKGGGGGSDGFHLLLYMERRSLFLFSVFHFFLPVLFCFVFVYDLLYHHGVFSFFFFFLRGGSLLFLSFSFLFLYFLCYIFYSGRAGQWFLFNKHAGSRGKGGFLVSTFFAGVAGFSFTWNSENFPHLSFIFIHHCVRCLRACSFFAIRFSGRSERGSWNGGRWYLVSGVFCFDK